MSHHTGVDALPTVTRWKCIEAVSVVRGVDVSSWQAVELGVLHHLCSFHSWQGDLVSESSELLFRKDMLPDNVQSTEIRRHRTTST